MKSLLLLCCFVFMVGLVCAEEKVSFQAIVWAAEEDKDGNATAIELEISKIGESILMEGDCVFVAKGGKEVELLTHIGKMVEITGMLSIKDEEYSIVVSGYSIVEEKKEEEKKDDSAEGGKKK